MDNFSVRVSRNAFIEVCKILKSLTQTEDLVTIRFSQTQVYLERNDKEGLLTRLQVSATSELESEVIVQTSFSNLDLFGKMKRGAANAEVKIEVFEEVITVHAGITKSFSYNLAK